MLKIDLIQGGSMVGSTSHRLSGAVLITGLLGVALWLLANQAQAEEVIFLQDGRTITADKTEVIGDRLRVVRPTETFDIPRESVLTIHKVAPPQDSPNATPPAEVYRDVTRQMNEKVRQDTQKLLNPPRVFPH